MKLVYLLLIVAINTCLFAQEDPNQFFPSSVGNVWEYDTPAGIGRFEIIKDSIDSMNCRYIFYYPDQPSYKLDSIFNVFYVPYSLEWLYYKLDADSGDIWIVDQRIEEDTTYMIAVVRAKYPAILFNRQTTMMEITFYDYQPDTVISEFSWPRFTEYLAYGIGEVMYFDEEGGGPQRVLQGCIINGDTIGTILTAANVDRNNLPGFELFQNYPNPFNPKTTIKFSLTEPEKVKLSVYSLLGEEIRVLVNEYRPSGIYSVVFDGSNLPSGVYVYTLRTNDILLSKKLILLK